MNKKPLEVANGAYQSIVKPLWYWLEYSLEYSLEYPCLAKLQPQSAANAFHSFHHRSKIYLLTGYIMIIEPHVFSIKHQPRVLSLTGMLNSATMASIYFFLLNELVKKRSLGKLKQMPNYGCYLLALDLFNFVYD